MWNRRDILKLGLSSWLLSQGTSRSGRAQNPRSAATKPRYYVFVLLAGGYDSVLTVDPKTRSEVEQWVDVPYRSNEIVSAGGLALGPHFAPLAKWAPQMAIINGIRVETANHHYGAWQAHRLKIFVNESMPAITDILGGHRDGQPIGTITLGNPMSDDYARGWFGSPMEAASATKTKDPAVAAKTVFDEIDGVAPADFDKLAAGLRAHRKQLLDGGARTARALDNLNQTIALFERLPHASPFQSETWGGDTNRETLGQQFQRILWALENDLTKCAFLRIGFLNWDSHFQNMSRQTTWNGHFTSTFDRFMAGLTARKNSHGELASNTTVVVLTDLGRFPKINPYGGKDHFPEAPCVLMGPWFKTNAAYGATGREMNALPVSLQTGRAEKGGHALRLDDIGTHLLRLDGLNPELYGYKGERLRFLESS
jgi:uncharacterized protein (DUF1501 family)